ncbi:hypothetical protein GGR57DRAFT_508750 [Xylariaceae sp. FL1272]|nr:hypothetical protein GGR57DRAFT_508750 [Xylariaceae sp. FL1272]
MSEPARGLFSIPAGPPRRNPRILGPVTGDARRLILPRSLFRNGLQPLSNANHPPDEQVPGNVFNGVSRGTQTTPQETEPPKSPWLQRFEFHNILRNDIKSHSGYAPEFPRLNDPLYYGEFPNGGSAGPQDFADADSVLFEEEFQRRQLLGLKTWEAGALSRYVRFSPESEFMSGGHRPEDHTPVVANILYYRDRIAVHEEGWLPLFRKDRWYDWIESKPSTPEGQMGKTWSVDDPRIWAELRVSLELADRMMKAIIHEQVDNVCDSHGFATTKIKSILLKIRSFEQFCMESFAYGMMSSTCMELRLFRTRPYFSVMRHKRISRGYVGKRTAHGMIWMERFNLLTMNTVWSMTREAVTGLTLPIDQHGATACITFHVGPLEALTTKRLSLAERSMLHYILAITFVHELTHAIGIERRFNDNYRGTDVQIVGERGLDNEPFIDAVGISELGSNIEAGLFGGRLDAYPDTDIPLVITVTGYPNVKAYGARVPNSWFEWQDVMIRQACVTPTYISKILSEAYWNDPSDLRKTANNYHRNPIIVSQSRVGNGIDKPERWGDFHIGDTRLLQEENAEDERVAEAWMQRHTHWELMRAGWYDRYKTIWDTSPWSAMFQKIRVFISKFSESYRQRDLISCVRLAELVLSLSGWTTFDRDMIHAALPTVDIASPHWFYWAIGLLMRAALPLQRYRMDQPSQETSPSYMFFASPSRAASAAGRRGINRARSSDTKPAVTLRQSTLPDQLNRGVVPFGTFSQLDYIDLADDLLRRIRDNEGLVWLACVQCVSQCSAALRTQRGRLVREYPRRGHLYKWASLWALQFPEASEALGSFDQTRGDWRERIKDPNTDRYMWAP